jgi:hypothetical protein
MRFAPTIFSLGLMGLISAQARASVIYSYDTDATAYHAAVGTNVTVNVYLKETLTGASTSYITAQGGLFSAGAGINDPATTASAQIVSGSFVEPSGFSSSPPPAIYYNQTGGGQSGSNLEFQEATAIGGSLVPVVGGQVLIGTFNIKVGSASTTYTLTSLKDDTIDGSNSQLGQSDGNTEAGTNGTGGDLDKVGNASYTGADAATPFTFTVSAPEPGSLTLVGLAGLGGLLLRRRNHAMRAPSL